MMEKHSLNFLANCTENCSPIGKLPLKFLLRSVHINGVSDYTLMSESMPLMNKDCLDLIPTAKRLILPFLKSRMLVIVQLTLPPVVLRSFLWNSGMISVGSFKKWMWGEKQRRGLAVGNTLLEGKHISFSTKKWVLGGKAMRTADHWGTESTLSKGVRCRS